MPIRRQQVLPNTSSTMERRFGLFADAVVIETNEPAILDAAEESFGRFAVRADIEPVTLRVLVDGESLSDRAGIAHRADGDYYLVTAPGDAAVTDLRASTATSFIERSALSDVSRLRYSFIEGPALAMVVARRGYFALHASGVALDGVGVALHGAEGAGKTTLAVACARRGLDVFAEDGVFVRAGPAGIEFWGLPWVQRLVLDSRRFFPELAGIDPRRQPNLELKIEVELDRHYPGRSRPGANPAAVVVLERDGGGPDGPELLDQQEKERAVEVQWPWPRDWTEAHERALELLSELPVYRLRVDGTPDEAVDHLEALLRDLAPVPLEA